MAKKIEELEIWERAKDLEVALNAIIDNVSFQRDWTPEPDGRRP